MSGAVHRAIGVAVWHQGSDLDAETFAVVPAPDDDCGFLVEPHRRSRSSLEEPSCLFGNHLEHLFWLRRRGDECRDATERCLLFGQAIRLAGLHVGTLARR